MLLGIYKSFDELEDNLTIPEMQLMLKAKAAEETRLHRVLAAVQGLPWDSDEKGAESAEEVIERMKLKAAAEASGKTEEQFELEALGIKFE